MKQFLVMETCEESSSCPYTLSNYLIKAASLKEAQATALKNVEEHFYRDTVERRFQSHRITIYQVTNTEEVDLRGYIAKWIHQKDVENQQRLEQAERKEFERLKQRFESSS